MNYFIFPFFSSLHILFASVAFMSIICLYIWLWCMYEISVPFAPFLLFLLLLLLDQSFILLIFTFLTIHLSLSLSLYSNYFNFIPSFANITISEIIIIIDAIVSSLPSIVHFDHLVFSASSNCNNNE